MQKKTATPADDRSPRDDSLDFLLVYPGCRARLNPIYVEQIACILLTHAIHLDRQSRASVRGLKGRARASVRGASKAALKMLDGIHWAIARLADTIDVRNWDDTLAAWRGEQSPHTHPNGLPMPRPDGDGPKAA